MRIGMVRQRRSSRVNTTRGGLRADAIQPLSFNEREMVCHYGKTTGIHCGQLYDLTSKKSKDDPNIRIRNLRVVRFFEDTDNHQPCDGGDSGGPWYLAKDQRRVTAVGEHQGNIDQPLQARRCVFSHIAHVQQEQNVDVYVRP
jgi:hypothetical protein